MITLVEMKGRLQAVSPSLLGLGAAILLFLLARVISTFRQFFRLRQYKGPPIAGFSKWWMIKHVGGGRTHLDVYEVCQKYGELPNKNQLNNTQDFMVSDGLLMLTSCNL